MQNPLLSKEITTRENRIWVRIIAACNVKCIFCLDADAQNGTLIDDAKIREQIRDGYKPGMTNRIIISGGEASIHPKFADYVRYAKSVWYDRVQTVTNGNMFARREFCNKLFDAWLDEVTFSIHGHTAKLHDYLTAAPGSYERAIRWLINVRKFFPTKIVNIDIVVNKMNVEYLPQMVKFFMRLGVYEFDILQIIPFGRGFSQYKDQLFYRIEDYLWPLHDTWKLSKIPGVYMWTNRFQVEAFEWYEDLIQDPRKIKSEVMWEALEEFSTFIESHGITKPHCYWEACDVCFLKQYCHDYIDHQSHHLPAWDIQIYSGKDDPITSRYLVLRWEEFPSQVYEKYGNTGEEFVSRIQDIHLNSNQEIVNIPRCIREKNNSGLYEWDNDMSQEKNVAQYTKNYILWLYRKKSTRCKSCKYNDSCEWLHINFIRSYWFNLLKPFLK